MSRFATCLGLLGFTASLLAAPAHGALGGDVASVQADAAVMGGQAVKLATTPVTVWAFQTPAEVNIRQYLGPEGRVVAVAWDGPVMPDLSKLLGTHYTEFETAARQPHGSRNALTVDTGSLVVQSGGRLRAFRGRAYLVPLPAGLNVEQIR